jgi:hypothetical protein
MALRDVGISELTIDDDAILTNIALYRGLRRHMKDRGYRFRVAEPGTSVSWDRALFLNLTFWTQQGGGDVLCDEHLAADVLAHAALHHIVNEQLAFAAAGRVPTATAAFFGESIASAFDLYLVGRLRENAPESDFIASQLPIMAETALQAGLSQAAFDLLIQTVQRDPERAFEDMRVLLFEVSLALHGCHGVDDALAVLSSFSTHRFASLLHHLQISNWVLHARAHATLHAAQDDAVHAFDATLRAAPCSLDWIAQHWIPKTDA